MLVAGIGVFRRLAGAPCHCRITLLQCNSLIRMGSICRFMRQH